MIMIALVSWKLSNEDMHSDWVSFWDGNGGVIDSTIKPCWVYQSLLVVDAWELLSIFDGNVSIDWIVISDVGGYDVL